MNVKELIKLLKTFPPNAEVMVRHQHDASFNPGPEGYDSLWSDSVFYSAGDNSVNIE
jgi:hypothetical protein